MGSEELLEQVVEFSVTIVDPGYSELLNGPETPQYHDITQELQDKVRSTIGEIMLNVKAKWKSIDCET